jgi:hypothetical protein
MPGPRQSFGHASGSSRYPTPRQPTRSPRAPGPIPHRVGRADRRREQRMMGLLPCQGHQTMGPRFPGPNHDRLVGFYDPARPMEAGPWRT